MIPRRPVALDPSLPAGATFWTPRPSEVGEGGIAYFHDVWVIRDVGVREARLVMQEEATLVELAGRCATGEEQFEDILLALESNDEEALPEGLDSDLRALVRAEMTDEPRVGCLDLGVAGLVYALAASGFWPAASCRGHGARTWAEYPVVYFAADRHRVEVLQPLVRDSRCGFQIDQERGNLLVIGAESVEDTMALAVRVLAAREHFPNRTGPRRAKPTAQGVQPSLWES